jgi:hypothetical protein
MKIIRDDIWLCEDCLQIAVNGDASCLDYSYSAERAEERLAEILCGLKALGRGLVPNFDSETGRGILEFSRRGCNCCGCRLAGQLHEFALLG